MHEIKEHPLKEENIAIPIVSIVGRSNTGKTTLIEKLIPELNQRGYTVATIKHSLHDFEIDREGKDSFRHKKAGAKITVIASPKQIAFIEDVDNNYGLAEIRNNYIRNVDIIISEGFKGNPHPKIEVVRSELKQELLCKKEDNLLAVVSDQPLEAGVACLDKNDIGGIADIIEKNILKAGFGSFLKPQQ